MQGTPIRKQANSLILNALAYPQLYDYSMLIKLLIIYFGNFASIETKPSLNLAFNASDVQNIEIFDLNQVIETQDKRQIQYKQITVMDLLDTYERDVQCADNCAPVNHRVIIVIYVNFLGLYGSSSPLPIYYSEGLIKDESDDNYSTCDFLSIFNTPIYKQYQLSVKKYRFFSRLIEDRDEILLERILAFAGLALKDIRKTNLSVYDVLPHIGVFSLIPRSREALKTILKGEFHDNVWLEEFVPKTYDIPKEQLMSLGVENSNLGENSYLGTTINSTDSAIIIHIKCDNWDEYKMLLPNEQKYKKLSGILSLFMMDRIDIVLDVELENNRNNFIRIGDDSILGLNSYIYGKIPDDRIHFKYKLEY